MNDSTRPPRRLVPVLVALLLPIALAAPIVSLMQRQARAVVEAGAEIDAALSRTRARTASLDDAPRLRAQLLVRTTILREIESGRPDVAAMLNAVGALPDNVRLDRLAAAGSELHLAGTSDRVDADLVAAVESSGLRVIARDPTERGRFAVRAVMRERQPTESAP